MLRTAGFALLAIAAAAVMFAMAPDIPEADTGRFDRLTNQALEDEEANQARTQGAPQQQVVNGWVNRDLLTVISRQMSAQIEATQATSADQRLPALLLILVLAVCWHGATLPTAGPAVPASPSPRPRRDDHGDGVGSTATDDSSPTALPADATARG